LEVSYRGEIRPESPDRVREVFEVQRDRLVPAYEGVLERGVSEGVLARADSGATPAATRYSLATSPGFGDRLRWRAFFRWSKVRATVRWAKYIVTYDNWADYIVRKAERRTGIQLELTPRERRLPFIFGWPKIIRIFRAMRANPSSGSTPNTTPGGDSP
jgi:hypothetical protein